MKQKVRAGILFVWVALSTDSSFYGFTSRQFIRQDTVSDKQNQFRNNLSYPIVTQVFAAYYSSPPSSLDYKRYRYNFFELLLHLLIIFQRKPLNWPLNVVLDGYSTACNSKLTH